MAETVRELVVSLSLSSSYFEKNIKSVNQRIKEAESRFKLASAGIENYENTMRGAGTQVSALRQKLELQNAAVGQFEQKLTKASAALEKSRASTEKQSTTLDANRHAHALLVSEIEKAEAAHKASVKATGDNSDASNELGLKVLDLKEKEKALSKEIQDGESKLSAATKSIQRNEDAVSKVQTGLNSAKAAVKETTSELSKLTSGLGKAGAGLGVLSKKAIEAGQSMSATGRTLTMRVTVPLAALGAYAFKAAVDFESAFAGVRKTVTATEDEFARLEQSVKNMSLKVPSNTTAISAVMEAAGQLGIANENLEGYTRTMIDIGNSTNLAATEAATAIAKYSNITGMAQRDAIKFGSALVYLGNNFATTELDIMNMATRLAAAGAQVGMTNAQILGFATGLSSVGIEVEAGGTAFSKAIIEMEVAVATGSKSLDDFAKISGMTKKQFFDAWKSEPAKAVESFIVGLSRMDEEGISAIATLDEMGFSEVRLRDTLLRATNATELFGRAQTAAASAWADGTALSAEAEQRYNTVASQLEILKNRVSLAAGSLGSEMVPMAKRGIEAVTELIDRFMALDTEQKEQIIKWGAIAAAAGPALMILGKFTSGAGKTIQAILAITRVLKGLSMVQFGWIGLAVAGIAGLTAAFIAAAKSGEDLESEWSKIRGRSDEKAVAELSAKINVDATVEGLEDSQARIEELKTWLKSLESDGILTPTESGNIVSALEGSYAPIISALISVGVPEDAAKKVYDQIKDAKQQVRNALLLIKPALTDQEVTDLVSLVGKPAEEIRAGLLAFGFDESSNEYQAMLAAITEANGLIDTAFQGVEGVSDDTLKTIKDACGDDHDAIYAALKSLGLSDADAYRIGVEILSPTRIINAATKGMYDSVIKTLTDGLPDDAATIAQLKSDVHDSFVSLTDAVNEQLASDIAAIDPTDPEYAAKVAALVTDAESAKAALLAYEAQYYTFIDTYAGKHADVVRQHADELLKLTGDVDAVLEYIRQAEAEVREAGRSAFELTASGVTLDKDTHAAATNYALAKRNSGIADKEAQYKKDVADLQARLQSGQITKKAYVIEEDILRELLTANKDAILAEYDANLKAIADGVAKASGEANWGDVIAAALDARDLLEPLMDSIENGTFDASKIDATALQNAFAQAFGEGFDPGELSFENSDIIASYVNDAYAALTQAVEGVDMESTPQPLVDLFNAWMDVGALEGLDISSAEAQVRLMAGNVGSATVDGYANAITANGYKATDAATDLGNDSLSSLRDSLSVKSPSKETYKIGGFLVDGLVNGVKDSTWKIRFAMIAMAQEAIKAAKRALGIASPSKLFRDEVGKMIVRGVGDGVVLETEAQRRTYANAARVMTASARAGVRSETGRITNDNRNQSQTQNIREVNMYGVSDWDEAERQLNARRVRRGRGYGLSGGLA